MNLDTELRKYGVPTDSKAMRRFGGTVTPDLLDYLDLVEPRGSQELRPDGVAESQGKPLLYFVNASRLAQLPEKHDEQLRRLRRVLGCRGQRAYLAVVKPGRLEVVPVSLDKRTPEWKEYIGDSGEAITFFSRLALGHYDGPGEPSHADYAFEAMLKLLTQACGQLADPALGLGKDNVLSLVGRALFFRFLLDRQIVKDNDSEGIAPGATSPEACFSTPEHAAATSHWLDKTFNGDFLPLRDNGSLAFFEQAGRQTDGEIFRHLNAIMHRYQAAGGRTYQKLLWSDFDFAHVPVGLLSQVYEAFCWKWEPYSAGSTSVYYTPRNIAATLVGEVFDGLQDAHKARVLDPACGGSVFLVLAFRRLYRALWEHTGERPDTKAIRRILENQLTGFDISESAIRLSALSLYLTAIELDPEPIPPEKLRFKELRGRALFNFRRKEDPQEGPIIGCLGEQVGKRFDIVLSNPPWTSLPGDKKKETRYKELAQQYTDLSRAVIKQRGEEQLAADYQNPDNAPDLPILWKSTEWCRPDGRIAMALPARILLKQEDVPKRARETLLQLVEITGIINGSNLADTPVWPRLKEGRRRAKMSQPFMLLFARNRLPKPGHAVRFITPQCDPALNGQGEVWIDSKSVQPVEADAAMEEPWLWKALAVGTALDVLVLRKLLSPPARPLVTYWRGHLQLSSSNGYQVKEKQAQRDASFLKGLPDLNSTGLFRFVVDFNDERLKPFSRNTLFRPHKGTPDELQVYRAPLAIVKECPGIRREKGRALLAFRDIAYNDSFNGYSAAGHPEGELLVRYLHLFVHSHIWMHYALLTSPKFGAERRRIYKSDLDDCPIVPPERLTPEQKQAVWTLSKRLVGGDGTVFHKIDAFFADLYGLDELDLEVIGDTLDVCLPYTKSRKRACQCPKPKEREYFRDRLEKLLRPFFNVVGQNPVIRIWKPPDAHQSARMPYGVLIIGEQGQELPEAGEFFQDKVVPLAIETGQTLIIQELPTGLLVAILNQYRYWTPSCARLLAGGILRHHMAPFGG